MSRVRAIAIPVAAAIAALLGVSTSAGAQYAWGGWGGWGTGIYVPQQMTQAHPVVRNVPYRVGKWELPKPVGTYVPAPPAGAIGKAIGGKQYFQAGPDFYLKHGQGLIVATPPLGGVLDRVPIGSESIRVGAVEYHAYNGAFVRRTPKGFEIVPAPVGAVVDKLPEGATETKIGGKRHYLAGGAVYRPYYRGATVVYQVVEPPKAEPAPK